MHVVTAGFPTLKSPGKCEEIATEGSPAATEGAVFYFSDEMDKFHPGKSGPPQVFSRPLPL